MHLAEMYHQAKQPRDGLLLLEQALPIVRKTQECIDEMALYKLMGQLLWEDARVDLDCFSIKKVESAFLRAIDLARYEVPNYGNCAQRSVYESFI